MKEGSACDSDVSSFELEESMLESDFVNSVQISHFHHICRHSHADADPLSTQGVCISGDCRPFACQPRVNSINEPFTFFTGSESNPVPDQPGRPPRVESPIWHHEIWDLLCEAGAVEMEEEGPIIYVNSYFISHLRTPQNSVMRPLRFDLEHESWEASVRFMWEDFVDQSASLDIFIVRPDPPPTIYEGTVATVLVVQHPMPRKAAIVVTALPDSYDIRHKRATALSVDPVVTQPQLIAAAQVQDLCNAPGCTTWVGAREFHADDDIRVQDGLSVLIRIPTSRLDPTQRSTDLVGLQQRREDAGRDNAEDDTDELQLLSVQSQNLQRTLKRTLRLLSDDQVEPQECSLAAPVANLRLDQPNIDGHHLEGLYEAWHQVSPVFAASFDEAAVTFMTWFVHGTLWTSCDSPRMLTLFPQRSEWDGQIRTLWRDKIHPRQNFEVSIVHPESGQASLIHVLVHQAIDHGSRGILLSTFLHAGSSQRHSQGAFVTPRQLAFDDLTRLGGFQRECQDRSALCVGFFGSDSLDEERLFFPRHGAHFELHIVDWDLVPPSLQPESVEPDALLLMQDGTQMRSSAPLTCGIDLPEQPHESMPFQFHVSAPVFVPGIPWDLHAYDEFVQDLFEAWNQVAAARNDEDRSCLIQVWFVDHQWQHPHGYAPRSVRLGTGIHEWRTLLWQAWQDHIIPGQELEYQLVTPLPHTFDRRVAAHVIIIQRPIETWVTSIVTLFDERALQSVVSQLAITTHEHILLDNLARVFGIFASCFGAVPVFSCLAWYRDLSMRLGAPIPGRSGMSINILLRHASAPQSLPVTLESDAHSLLQMPVQKRQPQQAAVEHAPDTPGFLECRLPDNPTPSITDQHDGTDPQLTPVAIPTFAAAHEPTPDFVFEILAELRANMLRNDIGQTGFVVRVWYIHHTHHRMSRIARFVHLSGPPHLWRSRLIALWFDRIVPFEATAIHVVKPRPFRTSHEQNLAFDLILSQGLHGQRMSGLISVYPSPADPTFPQFAAAFSLRQHASGARIISKLAFQQVCQMHRCQIFHRWNEIPLTQEIAHVMHDGDGFAVHIYRSAPAAQEQPVIVPAMPLPQPEQGQQLGETPEEEGPVLLQLESPLFVTQNSAEPNSGRSPIEAPIRVIGLDTLQPLVPSFVTVESPPTESAVHQEISCFGISCAVVLSSNHMLAVCVPEQWPFEDGKLLLLFTDMRQDFPDDQSAFLTLIDQTEIAEIQLMALLHRLGHEKAVIQTRRHITDAFVEIVFVQAGGTPEMTHPLSKQQKPWPVHPKGDRHKDRPMWVEQKASNMPPCLLDLGVSFEDLQTVFHSITDYLCQVTDGLPLPAVTTEAIADLKHHRTFDRLIIYADGSSQSKHKHVAPALNEELDVPDAWCFVVLGETETDAGTMEYTLVGWHAHQVRYDPAHPWYIGANHVGSTIAEKRSLGRFFGDWGLTAVFQRSFVVTPS